MIPYQNSEVIASLIFYLATKIVRFLYMNYTMHVQSGLTSIPELEVEDMGRKWVPKKKHEVLKAKYKCLKKLFQIYDASVIGILPEPNPEIDETKPNRRRKRSHRTKIDACAGTNEILSNGDLNSEFENTSVATAIIRELQIEQSVVSTEIDTKIDKYAETASNASEKELPTEVTCNCHKEKHNVPDEICPYAHPTPYLFLNERHKLTRFQCFVQRIFGIRRESYLSQEQIYPDSDSSLTSREKRRRRGLRFRRLRRSKKIKSESALRDVKSPALLSYVQSVQRNCLMDVTVRQCPIVGCNTMTYGIINYNDHLNLSHFKDRKVICHYCHEGFENEHEKLAHENEHIGINKLTADLSRLSAVHQTAKIASNTQTDPATNIPEDKLKKIVSFFDKISDPDQMFNEIKKKRSLDSNLRSTIETPLYTESEQSDKAHTTSLCNVRRKTEYKCPTAGDSLVICRYCGENFRFRRQLSLHVDLEHRVHDKFSKFHSCAGIVNCPQTDMISEDGRIKVQSDHSSSGTNSVHLSSTTTENRVIRRKSDETVACRPSSIEYYTSTESMRRPSVVDSLVKKVRNYRWEPGTKIIRV